MSCRLQWLICARKFWREELVRLKYHNPAVAMTVERPFTTPSVDEEATMSIHFASQSAKQTLSSATSSPAATDSTTASTTPSDQEPTDRIETINMKNRTNSEILQELMRITKAYPVEPTVEEQDEMRSLEEQSVRSQRDSKMSQEVRARVKREKELLEQARGDLASQPT